MHSPLRITFQGSEPSAALRQTITEHVATLERFHGRLTSCHVIFKTPDHHHRTGGLFEVSIHLVMPGNITVDIDQTPRLDERFADPLFAVADTFRRARRKIQDRARRQRGDVKTLHERAERSLDKPEG
ncbi:MAG: HPF/RaiA family ribosome-associated protein [Reyranellales bacterium]